MNPRRIALVLALGLVAAPASAVAVNLGDDYPTVGKETAIILDTPAKKITITYSPGAKVARTSEIVVQGDTPVRQLPWTPTRAGVVKIASDSGEETNVSVRFDGAPPLGIAIFLFAGAVLIGGATICLRSLFAEPR